MKKELLLMTAISLGAMSQALAYSDEQILADVKNMVKRGELKERYDNPQEGWAAVGLLNKTIGPKLTQADKDRIANERIGKASPALEELKKYKAVDIWLAKVAFGGPMPE